MTQVQPDIPGLWSTKDIQPFASYDRMRDEPVRWDQSVDGWVVTSYDLCRQVLRGDETSLRTLNLDNREVADKVTANPRGLTNLMGEEHRRVHQWWLRLLSPTQVEGYRTSRISLVINQTIDRFIQQGEADLVADYAKRIPIRVIAALMDMLWHDWCTRIVTSLDRVSRFFDRRPGDDASDSILASQAVTSMLLPYVRQRRGGEGSDMISIAWREGPNLLPDWGERDVTGMIQTMFLAGSHTTTGGITNAAPLLLTRPEVAASLRDDESLVPAFVEECLRLMGPAQIRAREANHDFEVGVTIRQDDQVWAVLASADRDPAKYQQPQDFEMDRRALRDHIAFNYGPRTCVGAALARAEIQESVQAVLHRLSNVRVDPNAPAPVLTGFALRSYSSLRVKFDAPSKARADQF
jgi:cytochrome P450